ncbi:MAG: cobalamin-dependent protein, partial [Chitinispirillaceae bacterium]|nr:cobalamin-dependent protein [Chitinispirillaceae bacterium]
MREAVAQLEPHLTGAAVRSRGTIVLATVFGDVHDIGKNLVGSILRNQGIEVIDLGKQVEIKTIVKAVREHSPDVVGLSALLVTTSREMSACVREFARQGISVPVIIGGAAVNRDFAGRIALLEDGTRYRGNVYYGRDAFEAVRIMEQAQKKGCGGRESGSPEAVCPGGRKNPAPEPVSHDGMLHPPFYGTSAVLRWESRQLIDRIDKERLFKAWWGGGKLDKKEYGRAVAEDFVPAFDGLRDMIEKEALLDAAGIYGFFPVITDGDKVILLDPSDFHADIASFRFPRMLKKKSRSIADYLRPESDLLAVQAVTIGEKISGRIREFFSKDGRYSLGFFLNGMGACVTELLADMVTNEITRGLGLPNGSGRRYSFGYPGMPRLEEQQRLFEIMAITERLGITLTGKFQMVPEHSTVGIYIHHPEAEYLG